MIKSHAGRVSTLLASALLATACGGEDDKTPVEPTPFKVRLFGGKLSAGRGIRSTGGDHFFFAQGGAMPCSARQSSGSPIRLRSA